MSNNQKVNDFSDLILRLTKFWSMKGCSYIAPYDSEVGAGTFHPATVLRALDDQPWNVAYVQPSRRQTDGRYGDSPNRLQHFYQFQVILKPAPKDVLDLYLESLEYLGIDNKKHDIRFVEDDWESPTLGAWGRGWEVWIDGMEVTQFTYFQQVGGIECSKVSAEITYGLERIAMYLLDIDNVYDLPWNKNKNLSYSDVYLQSEQEFCHYNFKFANVDFLIQQFDMHITESLFLSEKKLAYPAYHKAIQASNVFNQIEARGAVGVNDRALYINRVRDAVKKSCEVYIEKLMQNK